MEANQIKELMQQTIAGYVTGSFMGRYADAKLKTRFMKPYLVPSKPSQSEYKVFAKALKDTAIDKVTSLLIGNIEYNKPIRSLPYSFGESLISQSLDFVLSERKLPNKQMFTNIRRDFVKNVIYYQGKRRSTFQRTFNNALWGFIAGYAEDTLNNKFTKQKHVYGQSFKKGIQTAMGKVVYGEIYALVMNGEIW